MRLAEKNHEDGLGRLRRWWTNKYKRPPSDPLFTGQTVAELQTEMFEDLLVQREELMDRLDDATGVKERAEIRERLATINNLFGYEAELGYDPLIDEWERDLAEGRTPDLSKKIAG